MPGYRHALPQLGGGLYLADAGVETDLIFNRGIEIRGFAAHTLLPTESGRQALIEYFRGFLSLAKERNAGFILDSVTWKAHPHWADALGSSEEELRQSNCDAVELIARLRSEFASETGPIVLNGIIGPKGDAYAPEAMVAVHQAENYHAKQIGWLAATEVDMVTGMTFAQSDEASGLVLAARHSEIPVVVSFTVETDGRLPTGQPLGEAIDAVDHATDGGAAYFMVNCAHPDHFAHVLGDRPWAHRIRGIRCNASRRSHAELDASPTLDAGDPAELGAQYAAIAARLPWLNVFGGCCGSDLRHVAEIARAVSQTVRSD